jgi:hypothetical protein
LAQQNGAAAFFIGESENVASRLMQIYNTVTSPILTNVRITSPGITTYDLLPATPPNLSLGAQLLQAGRYVLPGVGQFQFRANRGQTIIDTSVAVDLSSAPDNKYVSRYWAAKKIQALLQDIERFGPRQELIDAVVYLSINYSVLSPYTAFLVIEPGAVPTTATDESNDNQPRVFALRQNYPNPFSPTGIAGQDFTTIRYTIPATIPPEGVRIELKIYNLLGQVVKVLALKQQTPGEYDINWDGRDETGRIVPAGVYLMRLVADPSTARPSSPQSGSGQRFVAERKVVVLR